MNELKNITKKITRLRGKISESEGLITSIITETETPEETIVESQFASLDCGHNFDPHKIFVDPFTFDVVCTDCTEECSYCSVRFWKKIGTRAFLTGDYYCPRHRHLAYLRGLSRLLFGGL